MGIIIPKSYTNLPPLQEQSCRKWGGRGGGGQSPHWLYQVREYYGRRVSFRLSPTHHIDIIPYGRNIEHPAKTPAISRNPLQCFLFLKHRVTLGHFKGIVRSLKRRIFNQKPITRSMIHLRMRYAFHLTNETANVGQFCCNYHTASRDYCKEILTKSLKCHR